MLLVYYDTVSTLRAIYHTEHHLSIWQQSRHRCRIDCPGCSPIRSTIRTVHMGEQYLLLPKSSFSKSSSLSSSSSSYCMLWFLPPAIHSFVDTSISALSHATDLFLIPIKNYRKEEESRGRGKVRNNDDHTNKNKNKNGSEVCVCVCEVYHPDVTGTYIYDMKSNSNSSSSNGIA